MRLTFEYEDPRPDLVIDMLRKHGCKLMTFEQADYNHEVDDLAWFEPSQTTTSWIWIGWDDTDPSLLLTRFLNGKPIKEVQSILKSLAIEEIKP